MRSLRGIYEGKKMKLLYIAPVYIEENCPDGVAKKVLNHFDVMKKKFDMWLVYYSKEGVAIKHEDQVVVKNYTKIHRRLSLYSEILNLLNKEKFNSAYIRYPKSEPHFIKLLKALKENGTKIIVEIPTYPYNGEIFHSVKTTVIALVDALFSVQLKKYVDRIVTYSDDEYIFGISTIRTINGIVYEKVKKHLFIPNKYLINMIAVATIYSCHGFDRIISGIEEYYQNGGTEEIFFNIVGNGPYVERYREQLEKSMFAKNHVSLCGFQTGEKLDALYNEANVAINSLAIHRIGLKKESTLKTKEYAAKGLPIISSYVVDAFDSIGNEDYVLLVDNTDEPIDMHKVISFYHRVYDGKNISDVSEHIREKSKMHCDMAVTLREVIDFFLDGDK